MKCKNYLVRLLSIGILFCCFQQSWAQEQNPVIRGGEVPIPYKLRKEKFELADGQVYLLKGRLMEKDTAWMLEVDLKSQPWLATRSRVSKPYYELDLPTISASRGWLEMEGKDVELKVRAHIDFEQSNEETGLVIRLEPLNKPRIFLTERD